MTNYQRGLLDGKEQKLGDHAPHEPPCDCTPCRDYWRGWLKGDNGRNADLMGFALSLSWPETTEVR